MKRPTRGAIEPVTTGQKLAFATYIPYLVNRAAAAMVGFASASFAEHGVTVPMWRVLFLLWERETCRFGTMSELTSIGPATLSRLTASMEEERLILRTRVLSDTRVLDLRLTRKGRQLIETMLPVAVEMNDIYLEGVSVEDQTVLHRTLARIHENVARATARSERRA